jgi:hypothetical protein
MAQYFTPAFKQRVRVIAATVTMLAGAMPFVLGLLAIQSLGAQPTGVAPAAIAMTAFVLGGLLPWLTQNLMGLAGNAGLRRRLAQRLGDSPLPGAAFVGFAPGQDLRVWHGETDRDIGFLCLDRGALVYRGDDYEWALPRGLIDHLDLTPAEGTPPRILIHWHVPREVSRTFSLESREAGSITAARRATQELFTRLKEWYRAQPDGAAEVAAATADHSAGQPQHGLPPTDLSGGQMVNQPASGSCVSILALGVIMLVLIWRIAGACFASGQYYEGILWAGLISVLGALGIGYLLHYLQAWEAAHGPQAQRER